MNLTTVTKNGVDIASVFSDEILINDVQSALDFIATVRYEVGCDRIILNKSVVCEDFFDLKTRLAGEIIQKFINYHAKIAIVGDFSMYSSTSLRDFIYECNHGRDLFFLPNVEQAIEKLSKV